MATGINPIDYLILRDDPDDAHYIDRNDFERALDRAGFTKKGVLEEDALKTTSFYGDAGTFVFTDELSRYTDLDPDRVREDDDIADYDVIEIFSEDSRVVIKERTDRDTPVQAENLGETAYQKYLDKFTGLFSTVAKRDRNLSRQILQLKHDWVDGKINLTTADFQELDRHERAILQSSSDTGKFIQSVRDRQKQHEKTPGMER